MSVRVNPGDVVVHFGEREEAFNELLRHAGALSMSRDDAVASVALPGESAQRAWIARLREEGFTRVVVFDAAGEPLDTAGWLDLVRERDDDGCIAWLRGTVRGELSSVLPIEHPRYQRHEVLSRSESGLHFVRDRSSGILRQLTADEMNDFDDPPPCPECGEQFGCDHFNCAGERLLDEREIAAEVPTGWRSFARDAGVSREDVSRLRQIELVDGEYRIGTDANADMRALELVLLLNESR